MFFEGEAGQGVSSHLDSWIEAARCGDAEALGRALEPFRDYLLLVANQELEPELSTTATSSSGITGSGCRSRRWGGGWESRPMPLASTGAAHSWPCARS